MRSSTSNFNRRAALVGSVLALVLVACIWLLDAVYHKKEFQGLAVDALSPATKLLAIGSSRVIFGFDPRAYEVPAVGLCANYLDLVRARELYEMHAPKLTGLKVLLLEFDDATLMYDTIERNPHGLYDLGYSTVPPPAEVVTHFDRAMHRLLAPVFNWRLTPAFFWLEQQTTNGLEPVALVPGHIPSRVTLGMPEFYAEGEVSSTRDDFAAAKPETLPRNVAAVAELVTAARAKGVEPVLVRFPHEPHLRKIYPAAWNELVAGAYRSLGERLGAATPPLWDYTAEERFATDDFRDPHHLNQKGAELLASLLAPRLRSWYNRSK